MKKSLFISFNLSNVLTLCLVFVLTFSLVLSFGYFTKPTVSNTVQSKNSVIVDAGHGGEDGGTQSSAGVLEKDVNLEISMRLGNLLKLLGYNVIYTRTEDKLVYGTDAVTQRQKKVSDIHYRKNFIDIYPETLFLSIHQNYFYESKYFGAQVFYSENNPKSKTFADSIQVSIRSLLQPENDRQTKATGSDIYLLYHAKSPAVMVECGFMSNAGVALLLSDDAYQKKMCLAVAAGISC